MSDLKEDKDRYYCDTTEAVMSPDPLVNKKKKRRVENFIDGT